LGQISCTPALDALGDENADFLGGGNSFDGVGRADFDAEVAADAGFAVVGHLAAQFVGDGDGGIQPGFAFADFFEQAGDGGGQVGGGEGVVLGLRRSFRGLR
jgi:hypothetical protein